MYCCLKYWEPSDKSETESFQSYTTTSMHSVKSFVQENKELLINPNCPIGILMDFICETLGLEKNGDVTLCDERGILSKINKRKPTDYATDVLKPKHTYVVVLLENDLDGRCKKIRPLLNKQSKLYADLMPKLKKNLPSRRLSAEVIRSSAGSISEKRNARRSSLSPTTRT